MHASRWHLLALLLVPSLAAPALAACGGQPAPTPVPPLTTATAIPTSAIIATPDATANASLIGPDEAALDRSVSPCDDFYQFACGSWMKATPIPEDEAAWVRSFSVIHDRNYDALRAILERDAQGDTRGDAYGQQLGDFYAACMDEKTVDARALDDLKPELKAIDAVHDTKSLLVAIAHLHAAGVGGAFNFGSEVDFKDATRDIAGVHQGGLGLPERDYYFRDDQRAKDMRAAYEQHVTKMLELGGEKPPASQTHAKAIVKIETELATASMTNTELRDPQKIYHKVDLDGLRKLSPDLPWDAYLAEVGFPSITQINVGQPDFVKKLDALSKSVTTADWREYLKWHLLHERAPLLTHAFVDEWFHFRQVLTGTKKLQPRWKRCVRMLDQQMGEALAQPFVKEHLGEDGKRTASEMVDGIEASMKKELEGLAWMDAATRTKAEEKLAKIVNKIGYPSKWRSYDGLVIERASLVHDVARAEAFEVRRDLTKVGKPVDREEWEMTPPTVNAYYEATVNEMVFPAGILQTPFYAKTQTPALNFGAIGMVVGHELTHGFDDEGRQFDGDGNLRDWWTPSVSAEFDQRAACVEKQFDDYVAVDDLHVKGKLTLGENIADLGGLKLSFATFERAEKEHPATPVSSGFTPEQQFFLGFAQAWCSNDRPESLRLLVSTNEHAPPRFRTIGPLSNLPEFAEAFQCKDGSAMTRPVDTRCVVW
jgi:putative endopeptidase